MKKYESIVILKSDITNEEKKDFIKKCKKVMKKGTVEEWGIRKLAYPIKKQNEGYYILFNFEHGDPNCDDLEKEYQRNEKVLKFIIIRKDDTSDD